MLASGTVGVILTIIDLLLVFFIVFKIIETLERVGGLPLAVRFTLVAFLLALVNWISEKYHVLTFTGWAADKVLTLLVLSIPIIFQPEFRRALQRMELLKLPVKTGVTERVIDEVVEAANWLRDRGYGALIIFERGDNVGDVTMGRGTIIDANVSAKLLETIFFPETPLHDGAVIINQKGRLWAAGYIVPIPDDIQITEHYRTHFGTRHTAALAITREKDVVALVVSEEKRWIRIAYKGRMLDDTFSPDIKDVLRTLLVSEGNENE